jgi:GABA(A) receptor-associated protein
MAESLIENYQGRIPVIIERDASSRLPQIDKKKLLVPHNMTVGAFIITIRRRIKIENYQSLFLITKEGNVIPDASTPMSEVYQKYKSENGFLYLIYRCENAFGGR